MSVVVSALAQTCPLHNGGPLLEDDRLALARYAQGLRGALCVDINAVCRTHILQLSYRNTVEILTLAKSRARHQLTLSASGDSSIVQRIKALIDQVRAARR